MLGWSIRARACRSASKRAMTWRLSMPGLMTFRATLRRTGSVCSAMKTVPMPPSPICCSSLYGPMTVPGRSRGEGCRLDVGRAEPRGPDAAGRFEEAAGLRGAVEQGLDRAAERRVAAAGPVQERRPLGRRPRSPGRRGRGILRSWRCHRQRSPDGPSPLSATSGRGAAHGIGKRFAGRSAQRPVRRRVQSSSQARAKAQWRSAVPRRDAEGGGGLRDRSGRRRSGA